MLDFKANWLQSVLVVVSKILLQEVKQVQKKKYYKLEVILKG